MQALPDDFEVEDTTIIYDKQLLKCNNCNEIIYDPQICNKCGAVNYDDVYKIIDHNPDTSSRCPIVKIISKKDSGLNESLKEVASSLGKGSSEILKQLLEADEKLRDYLSNQMIMDIITCYHQIIPSVKKGRKNIPILGSIAYSIIMQKYPAITRTTIINALNIDERSLTKADKEIESLVRTKKTEIKHVNTTIDSKLLALFRRIFTLLDIDMKYLSVVIDVNNSFSDSKVIVKLRSTFSVETGAAAAVILLCNELSISYNTEQNIGHITNVFGIKMPSIEKQLKIIKSNVPFIITNMKEMIKKL